MKVANINGLASKESIKIFKPTQRILLVADFGTEYKEVKSKVLEERIRVRLENSSTGQSVEIVPNMSMLTLSEIASTSEGFFRVADIRKKGSHHEAKGLTFYPIVLNVDAALDLSSDKYLEVDLFGLMTDEHINYSLYAIEGGALDSFYNRYKKYNLSAGESQKTFAVGENEALCLPYEGLKEVQMFTKDHGISPTYTIHELRHLADITNDICLINADTLTYPRDYTEKDKSQITGAFGSNRCVVLPLEGFESFEVRRDEGTQNYEFYMIDNKA